VVAVVVAELRLGLGVEQAAVFVVVVVRAGLPAEVAAQGDPES
jgi:hypothetical protein